MGRIIDTLILGASLLLSRYSILLIAPHTRARKRQFVRLPSEFNKCLCVFSTCDYCPVFNNCMPGYEPRAWLQECLWQSYHTVATAENNFTTRGEYNTNNIYEQRRAGAFN